ncbi:hypothetical protein [Neobacillus sp.]|jgi:hypothetical protein|uniref:hypothetical protein n=1 Tax=Neobacillus sp. TaxID=2675273 RepID=UPI0035B523ED
MSKKTIQGQEDIFSMFGIVDEYAEQQKREAEERARKVEELKNKVAVSKETKQSAKNNPVKNSFDINENTVIRYFGESIDICTYFTTEEIAEGLLVKNNNETERKPLDGELLRKRMEKDFPELVKDMTEMVYLKEKNIIIPVMKAKKKGNFLRASSLEGVSFRIPFHILRDFIAIARLYAEQLLEIHADIYMNHNGQFFLDVPPQQVHRYWCAVTEEPSDIALRIGDAIKLMEIHSHHLMKPIPSWQDNMSERVPGMTYVIVGNLQKPFPDITVRRFVSEEVGHISLQYNEVFEDPFFNVPPFDMSKIEVAGI